MLKLHNTLGRRSEDFKPLKAGQVSLYTCGPTVYDYATIGNLRAFVFDDTLRRVLEANDYQVKHVMNITDVGHLVSDEDEGEDKLEKGAQREGKSVWDVAEHYTKAFQHDMAALNVLPPNGHKAGYAKATDFIDEQIEIVKILMDKEFAYQTEQAIYFDVSKLENYGKLTGQKLSDKEVGARSEVVTDAGKRNPQDFALWFLAVGRFADHTMRWPSPWGEGFPGWHLECSAIIHATLNEPIDIHTGGVDHIGTHHTNEIAQSEAAYGPPLANFWLHNEFLLVDGQKMAKSKGSFVTLQTIIDKGFEPLALRLLFLQVHYRSQMNFTWEALTAAQEFLVGIYAWADLQFQPSADKGTGIGENYDPALAKMKQALNNDLSSAEALAVLSELVSTADEKGIDGKLLPALLTELDNLFGLGLSKRKDLDADLKDIIDKREKFRLDKDWSTADKLRGELTAKGIELNDTASGPIWSRSYKT